MQMSIERFREIHKLIWNFVIAHAKDVEEGRCSVNFLKEVGLSNAYCKRGLLDFDEVRIISDHHSCLLCASSSSCHDCVLGSCIADNSLYKRARGGNVSAMAEIRDVVDKRPYTDLSVITLRD